MPCQTITADLQIRKLSYKTLRELSDLLDINGPTDWRALIAELPPNQSYSRGQIAHFEREGFRPGCSSSLSLLTDLGHQLMTVGELASYPERINHQEALLLIKPHENNLPKICIMLESLKDRPLRWGVLGAGKISEDFCSALKTLEKTKHVLQHVAARDIKRAEILASRFSVVQFSDDYKKVVEDEEIDIVYIGTINTTHKDLSILAINHGKAVLCEKPATMGGIELHEVLESAQKNSVFFMEAMWTRCFPLYKELLAKIESNYYGDPCILRASFGIHDLFQLDRIWNPLLGGSVTTDIGIYLLTVADMFFGKYNVKDFNVCGHIDEKYGIDRNVCISITYEGNKMVQLMASGDHELPNHADLICSNGRVRIEAPFWCPEKYEEKLSNGDVNHFEYKLPVIDTNFKNSAGLRFEAEHVRECLVKNLLESPIVTHTVSKRIMGYIDDVLRQLGAKVGKR